MCVETPEMQAFSHSLHMYNYQERMSLLLIIQWQRDKILYAFMTVDTASMIGMHWSESPSHCRINGKWLNVMCTCSAYSWSNITTHACLLLFLSLFDLVLMQCTLSQCMGWRESSLHVDRGRRSQDYARAITIESCDNHVTVPMFTTIIILMSQ